MSLSIKDKSIEIAFIIKRRHQPKVKNSHVLIGGLGASVFFSLHKMSSLNFKPYFKDFVFLAKWQNLIRPFRVGRSDIDVHTYKSIHNLKYGEGRDLFPRGWKGFLYIVSHPQGDPLFKGVPDGI